MRNILFIARPGPTCGNIGLTGSIPRAQAKSTMSLRARSTGEIVRPDGVRVNGISQIHTLQDLVRGLAAFGEIPAVISFAGAGKQEMTFGELENRVMRLTGGLLAKGIGRGDVVAILAPNQPPWMVFSLALVAPGPTLLLPAGLLSDDEPPPPTGRRTRAAAGPAWARLGGESRGSFWVRMRTGPYWATRSA